MGSLSYVTFLGFLKTFSLLWPSYLCHLQISIIFLFTTKWLLKLELEWIRYNLKITILENIDSWMGLYNVGIVFTEVRDSMWAIFIAEISIFFLYTATHCIVEMLICLLLWYCWHWSRIFFLFVCGFHKKKPESLFFTLAYFDQITVWYFIIVWIYLLLELRATLIDSMTKLTLSPSF